MTKFGQAEYAEYLAELFMKSKLDKILETAQKQDFNNRNIDEIYKEFPSAKDAA